MMGNCIIMHADVGCYPISASPLYPQTLGHCASVVLLLFFFKHTSPKPQA